MTEIRSNHLTAPPVIFYRFSVIGEGKSVMPPHQPPTIQLAAPPAGTWVQIDRAALERAAHLAMRHPKARALLDLIIARSGRHNALVASQSTLAALLGCSLSTAQRAIRTLRDESWIEVRQIGATGTACAYIVNDRVSWSGPRDGIRYSLFSAAVLVTDVEQPDRDDLGAQPPLEQIPTMYPGERQLPTGNGLPPPSQPSIPGMEPDLPARRIERAPDQLDIEDFTEPARSPSR